MTPQEDIEDIRVRKQKTLLVDTANKIDSKELWRKVPTNTYQQHNVNNANMQEQNTELQLKGPITKLERHHHKTTMKESVHLNKQLIAIAREPTKKEQNNKKEE